MIEHNIMQSDSKLTSLDEDGSTDSSRIHSGAGLSALDAFGVVKDSGSTETERARTTAATPSEVEDGSTDAWRDLLFGLLPGGTEDWRTAETMKGGQ